jgi:hypothetical protein
MTDNPSAPERAQASFRQLSTSAATLNAVSDELRKTISELETAIKKLNLGISAWVKISESHDDSGEYYSSRQLGYTRIKKEWCIALRTLSGHVAFGDDDEEIWPFNESPRWMRVEAVGKIPELLESLVKQVEETAKNIKNKTAEAKALAAAVETAAVAPKQKEDAPPKRPPAPPVPPNVTQPTPLPSLTTGPLSHLLGKRNEGVK